MILILVSFAYFFIIAESYPVVGCIYYSPTNECEECFPGAVLFRQFCISECGGDSLFYPTQELEPQNHLVCTNLCSIGYQYIRPGICDCKFFFKKIKSPL